jgi:hypothetical protein
VKTPPRRTPLQELQTKRLLAQATRLSILFEQAKKQWLRAAAPSLAIRQMESMEHLLLRHLGKTP